MESFRILHGRVGRDLQVKKRRINKYEYIYFSERENVPNMNRESSGGETGGTGLFVASVVPPLPK